MLSLSSSVALKWYEHKDKWKDCERCPLHQHRQRVVLVRGYLPCKVLFIGEAPGESEDSLGEPFVGPSGHMLDRIISEAQQKSRKPGLRYAITNVISCFPLNESGEEDQPSFRKPEKNEVKQCRPRLLELIQLASPSAIVTVGSVAAWALPKLQVEQVHIVHPSYILRSGSTTSYKRSVLTLSQLFERA